MNLATRLTISFEVPSQNRTERRHWSTRAKERRDLNWMIAAALPRGGCQHDGRRRRIQILAYRRRRITDQANLVGGCKTLVDALVATGVIVDDSEQWVDLHYEQGLYRTAGYDRPTTVIRIYDIEPAA